MKILPIPPTQLAKDVLRLQIDHAYRQLGVSLAVNLINGLVLALMLWGEIQLQRLGAWLLALYAVILLRYLILRGYRRSAARSSDFEPESGSLFVLGALASGLVWGSAGIVLYHGSSVPHQIFLAFVLGGMVAGALPLLSTLAPSFALFTLPISLTITLQLLQEHDQIHITMAILFAIYTAAMLVSSANFNRVFRDSIELRLKLSSSIEEKQQEALLARIDTLTGIANRRLFDEALSNEWKRAQRTETCLSMLIADIDYFKLYNDHLGHVAGDDCLRQVAASMATAARRPGDLVARIGGEEFAFLLPSTDVTDAAAIAERIREDIQALQIQHPASPISDYVTVSLGAAALAPIDASAAEELIEAADAALYRAKNRGRNRVDAGK